MNQSKSQLGLFTLTGLVIANMIGAGVFTTSGFAMGDLGSPHWVMLAWVVGGFIALCGAISYGHLSSLLPESGGEYLFLSRNMHPLVGFIAGWISLLAGFTGAIAYAAMTFEAYILPAESSGTTENLIASMAIIFAALIHGIRLNTGTRIQNTIVLLKIILISLFVVLALFSQMDGSLQSITNVDTDFSIYAFAVTVMWISFSYSGFNAAVYIAGEVPKAKTIVPRSMFLGTLVVTLIYLILNAIFVYLPESSEISFQQDIAAIVAFELGGTLFVGFVRFVIALALLTSISAMIMIGPRVYAKMAEDGFLPAALRLHGQTPGRAILFQALLAVVVVWISTLRELLSYLGFTLSLCLALTIFSLFLVLRKQSTPIKLPGYPWAPIIFILATLFFAAFAAINQPMEMLACIVTFILGAVMYFIVTKSSNII